MHHNVTRPRRIKATDDFLKDLESVPLVARSGDRYRYGKGATFVAKHPTWAIFFKDGNLMRELGQCAFEEGGLPRMRDVWEHLYERRIIVGYNFDGIGGWWK